MPFSDTKNYDIVHGQKGPEPKPKVLVSSDHKTQFQLKYNSSLWSVLSYGFICASFPKRLLTLMCHLTADFQVWNSEPMTPGFLYASLIVSLTQCGAKSPCLIFCQICSCSRLLNHFDFSGIFNCLCMLLYLLPDLSNSTIICHFSAENSAVLPMVMYFTCVQTHIYTLGNLELEKGSNTILGNGDQL